MLQDVKIGGAFTTGSPRTPGKDGPFYLVTVSTSIARRVVFLRDPERINLFYRGEKCWLPDFLL